ncbi:MAG: response regulator [bacterium]|nr:response regulator [bacterium]
MNDPEDPESLRSNALLRILEDPRDNGNDLWRGTREGGLNRFHIKTGKCKRYMHDPENESSISSNKVYDLYMQKNGVFWLGTWSGINRFDIEQEKFYRYLHDPNDPGSISSNRVTCVVGDLPGEKNLLWIATWGGGLNKFDTENEKFTRFSKKQGLHDNILSGIIPDNKGNLWISSPRGISRFNRRTGEIRNFKIFVGTKSNAYNAGAYFKMKSGEMAFGGILGYTTFYPERIADNPHIPAIELTSFKIFNKDIKMTPPVWAAENLELTYKDKFFSFEFAALEYSAPEKNRYAYKMEGFDNDWIFTDAKKRFASYTNLDPGPYTFRVKGSNNDNVWNETGVALNITITPPFWKTLWFRLLLALFILSSTYFVVRARIKNIEEQKKTLERLVDKRTEELKKNRDEQAKINSIVKSINSEADLITLLESVLKKTFVVKGIEKATALVYNQFIDAYIVKASIGWDINGLRHLRMSKEEVHARYIKNSHEMAPNIFIAKSIKGRPGEEKIRHLAIAKTMLIIRIKVGDEIPGYLVFDNMQNENVFENQSLSLLANLQEHIASAFMKSKMLLELKTTNLHLKEARQRAEKDREIAEGANRSKSEFLARMSHEIRTPMNSVLGFAEMLMDTGLDHEQADYAKTINQSGEALLSLLNDILDFSKIEAGQLSLEPIDFDPEVTAFSVCDLILPKIGSRPIEILCRIGDNIPAFVKGDPGRFRQVLVNLMGNAEKFTQKGEIELSLQVDKETDNRLRLHARIRDTGIGIPPEKLETIFEVFQQADGSTTRKFGGTGLGLSICKQISHLMEGEIHVESKPGEGSTFHFTAWLEKSARKPVRNVYFELLAGKKVLIVDDNLNNLEILKHTLSHAAGMNVTALESGNEVLPTLKKAVIDGAPFDISILDIQMPGIDGYQLANTIRSQPPPLSEIPLMAFSSSAVRHAKKCKAHGFNAYLPKPIHRKKLLKMVQRLLGQKKKRDHKEIVKEETIVTTHTLIEDAKHSVRILLAEDNPVNQKLARFMLRKAGYQLEVANNGQEAVDIYSQNPENFDLIFMDIQMPELDGKEATKAIREKGFTKIPIIAMTAQTMKGDKEKCLEAGMNDYMPKPIKRQAVFAMVKKWVLNTIH